MESKSGHIVLCGLGGLGLRTFEELIKLGEEVVVIAAPGSDGFSYRARSQGATIVEGNYREEPTLRAACFVFNTDPVDAVYNTVAVIVSGGLGDVDPRAVPLPIKLFGIALMLIGATILTVFYALITDAIVSTSRVACRRLQPHRLRQPRWATKWQPPFPQATGY